MEQQQHMFTNRMIRNLLIPVVLEQLLNSIMGTADTMMVSNVGSAAISAVHKRNRADKLEESYAEKHGDKMPENGMKDIVCPNCGTRGQWTEPRDFNMMLRTHLGPVEDENSLHYLRPETALRRHYMSRHSASWNF